VEVASRGRPLDVLVRQILRLFDVRHAFLVEPQAAGQRLVC
jgi:acetolactate synthase regulatory subunit